MHRLLPWVTCALLIGLLAACGSQIAEAPAAASTATATSSPALTATPDAAATVTVTPSRTPTSTLTRTPSPTGTPAPTATASPTPTPGQTPTLTPVPPTPTATGTPTPAVDFHIASWRLWPLDLNSGCETGMHTVFIHVRDASGAPLDGIVVGDTWNNVEEVSGRKGAGRTEINLWSNTMEIMVKRDAESGQPYSSEVSFPFSSFMTTIPNEQLIQAGYCSNELECDWKREHESFYCGGHYSWEVVFQRTE